MRITVMDLVFFIHHRGTESTEEEHRERLAEKCMLSDVFSSCLSKCEAWPLEIVKTSFPSILN